MSVGGARRFARLRQSLLGRRYWQRYRFTSGNEVKLLRSGDEFFSALVARVDAAERDVVLETYIFCYDEAGQMVNAALVRAAARGVRVRVITDGVGTARLPMFNEWVGAGIEHRIYNPHIFGRFGFSRTHRKLAVIDDQFAYCGGINIVDDYENNGETLPYRRWDFAVELRGPVVNDVRQAFEVQWRRIRVGHRPLESLEPDLSPKTTASLGSLRRRRRRRNEELWAGGQPCVAFVARDNLINRRAIEKAYLAAIGQARSDVLLANPYFMPGRKLRRALVYAARRGVVVKLIIGRKEFKALDYAVPFLYRALLRAGVQIAEYEKTLLHGKVAVVDSNWATVGSSNLDALSLMLNNEANVVLVNDPSIDALREAMLAAFKDARRIDEAHYDARPAGERLLNWLAYTTYRLAMKLLTVGGYD
ncbi:MAG: Cardiolipin synthase (EC bacterial type ClsB, has minor trans-phosphatidylation activity converting PE to PG [uncultured Paraburkholderia sp.]|nr:MAG: Cardiolipin synthase (EC bacterial type ClsB, has minor trans-phosphatidylation activity converting PE to PG [uncultured Paraburkholderia sp.]CAH2804084.1 MAG: Cardiolipin synthase (EC bacterial type ClsB, has minor trans-phosphatidylation activity converting PE to PG [uncultured Paraburkholderia sp.]CAH2938595.1 MAG: Cardiolipin synthase (EC bacterial type ClsB, has minor trans-phosphatidylation activity converting PE to PG [uncultured Paraburkholderia sp.]CAH2940916.1 MAG: Cardiolipin 